MVSAVPSIPQLQESAETLSQTGALIPPVDDIDAIDVESIETALQEELAVENQTPLRLVEEPQLLENNPPLSDDVLIESNTGEEEIKHSSTLGVAALAKTAEAASVVTTEVTETAHAITGSVDDAFNRLIKIANLANGLFPAILFSFIYIAFTGFLITTLTGRAEILSFTSADFFLMLWPLVFVALAVAYMLIFRVGRIGKNVARGAVGGVLSKRQQRAADKKAAAEEKKRLAAEALALKEEETQRIARLKKELQTADLEAEAIRMQLEGKTPKKSWKQRLSFGFLGKKAVDTNAPLA